MNVNNVDREDDEQVTIPDENTDQYAEVDKIAPLPNYIGPYKIEALLSKGGMSLLYLGIHPDTKAPITVKVLSPHLLSNKEVVDRFVQEAEIISITDHPNIIKLYGQGSWEGGLYIAMEFVQGISLAQFIKQSAMSLQQSLKAILEVCYALSHLHAHGIIHRDLKPENILLTDKGNIKVIDFGVAQLTEDVEERHLNYQNLSSSRIMGTPVYMSPEQKKDPNNVSYTSDIYSLGLITYELVIGQLSHGIVHLKLIPKGLRAILKQCLEIDPKQRYQDIVDLIEDLKNYLSSPHIISDQRGADYVNELVENLRQAQDSLLPRSLPPWEKVEMGIFNHRAQSVSGIYFAFLDVPGNSYGIIMGEPCSQGIETILYSAVLRGMFHSLCNVYAKPVDIITKLNDLLINDSMDQMFTMSYLVLNPSTNTLSYISCGYGNLWLVPANSNYPQKITADNIALGIDNTIDFAEVSHPWNIGDKLILNSFSTVSIRNRDEQAFTIEDFKSAIEQTNDLPPQRQVHLLFRKVRSVLNQPLEPRPITLISILRNN